MHQILLDYGLYMIWGIALAELIMTCILFKDHKQKRETAVLCMALIGIGLCYDAVILSVGGIILQPFLAVLSRVRFVAHGVLLPLNLALCAEAVPLYRKGRIACWVISALLMAAGGTAGFLRDIDYEELGTIARFAPTGADPGWVGIVNNALTYGTVLIIAVFGIVIIIKQKAPWFLLAAVSMFGFSALGPATGNFDFIFLIGMFGELLMLLFYLIHEKRQIRG